MFATQLLNRVDALVDGSHQPVTPGLIGITDDPLRHDSLDRCRGRILPSNSARGQGVTHVLRLNRFTFVLVVFSETCVYR